MTAMPRDTRAWIEDVVGAAIVSTAELPGATTATVQRLEFTDGRMLVAKRFDRQDFLDERPDRAEHEAAVLKMLESTPVPVPGLVAVDGSGETAGRPTVLMTWIAGAAALPDGWPAAVAENLVDLHRVDPGDIGWAYERYNASKNILVPSWASDRSMWEDAFAIADAAPETVRTFIHRDYHGSNLLWNGSRLAGVLDWLSGCIGPPSIDLAHLRLNLAMDHDTAHADSVLAEYLRRGEPDAWHPAWEVVDALDFLPCWMGEAAVEQWTWDHRPMQVTQERFDGLLRDAVRRASRG